MKQSIPHAAVSALEYFSSYSQVLFIGLAAISNFILNYLQVPKFDFLEFEKSSLIVGRVNLCILLPMNMCVCVCVCGCVWGLICVRLHKRKLKTKLVCSVLFDLLDWFAPCLIICSSNSNKICDYICVWVCVCVASSDTYIYLPRHAPYQACCHNK